VVAADVDDRYLAQGKFAAQTLGLDIEFIKSSVYDADKIPGEFDYVLFLGVFYHLRYPLLALDRIVKKVGRRLVFQTMLRGSESVKQWDSNYHFWEKEIFADEDFPRMYFIEHEYSNDPTNWFIPNRAGAEAALRSAESRLLADAVAELPLPYREVIILRELEELSYKEIARVADIPVGTVMSRLAPNTRTTRFSFLSHTGRA